MSGYRYLLDTNAILYILNGDKILAELLYERMLHLSIISEIELLSYKNISAFEEKTIKEFILQFSKVGITDEIKENAIFIRRHYSLKVPESLIAASAVVSGIPLVTSDKQFTKVKELELLYYEKQ